MPPILAGERQVEAIRLDLVASLWADARITSAVTTLELLRT
jgi:hypothetical protein